MPLRAKYLPQQSARAISSSSKPTHETVFQSGPDDDSEDVLFGSIYGLRTIELNRPKKLNSLNLSMINKIGSRLAEWSKSDLANVVLVKGAGDKAFCAGGDVMALVQWNQEEGVGGPKRSVDYFAREYQLDHLIATYNKPYIAFMDGISMGGGVGLSVHAPFRIATERTVFAMPETTIGFFPDVGASFFLPRLAGETGTYLALTSERLHGPDVFFSGIATHYLHSTSLPQLEARLAELRFKDYDGWQQRQTVVNATIEEFCTGLPEQPIHLAGELRLAIDRCFAFNNIYDILNALEEESAAGGPIGAWAKATIETLHKRSPLSVHVALKQMRIGRKWTIVGAFVREHMMAAKFMKGHDFNEGIVAQLGKPRRQPQWQPASLEDIDPSEDVAEPYFLIEVGDKKLDLLNDEDYEEYRHAMWHLPTEQDVRKAFDAGPTTKNQVVRLFMERTKSKQGVKEHVREILDRNTEVNENGLSTWKDVES